MTAFTSTQEWSPATTIEPDQHALAGEHALLLRDLRRRADAVLALAAAHVWPVAELRTLIRFVRTDVLRQASDEEALLYPNRATPFTELSSEHAHLYTLTDRLEQVDPAAGTLSEVGRLVHELLRVFEQHLIAEEAALAVLADTAEDVPAVADRRSGARAWLLPDDGPVLITLDALPRERAVQICIERLLRLRPGQCADVHSSSEAQLRQVCRWMSDFDTVSYGLTRLSSASGWPGLRISRRQAA